MPVFTKGGVKVLYIHVPKTGGRSVQKLLLQNGFASLTSDGGIANASLQAPCSPRHYHAELLKQVFQLDSFDYVFMTVRNPLGRAIAEYKMRWAQLPGRPSFDAWIEETVAQYPADPFVWDNHLRPQHEFVVQGCDIYRHEDLFDELWVEQLSKRSGLDFAQRGVPVDPDVAEGTLSPDVTVGSHALELVERFYAQDYATFRYDTALQSVAPAAPINVTARIAYEDTELPEQGRALLSSSVKEGRWVLIDSESHAAGDFENLPELYGGEPIPEWWRGVKEVWRHSLSLYKLQDAVVFPASGVIMSGDGRIMNHSFVEASYLYGSASGLPGASSDRNGNAVIDVSAAIPSDNRVIVSMPWGGLGNYGHFVLDCLPTLAVCQQFRELDGWVRMFPPLQPWHQAHLTLLGVEGVVPHEAVAYRVKEVVWSNVIEHFLHAPNMAVLLVRDIQRLRRPQHARLASEVGPKIWLSRKGNRNRRFAREEELEVALQQRGFSVIQPQELSPIDQMQVFENASVIAGFSGAAFTNVLYARPRAIVIEIMPEGIPGNWVRSLSALVGCTWIPFFCRAVTAAGRIVGGEVRPELDLDLDMSLDSFLKFLDKNTAPRSRPTRRLSMPGPKPVTRRNAMFSRKPQANERMN